MARRKCIGNGCSNKITFDRQRLGDKSYDPDSLLYFAELTGALTDLFKDAIDWGIKDWKATGNWDRIDRAFWMTTPNQQNTLISIKNPTSTPATEGAGGPPWTPMEWRKGNGAGYLNLKYVPANDGVNFTKNNAGFTMLPMQHALYGAGGLHFGALDGAYRTVLYFSASKAWSAINGDINGSLQDKTAGVFTITRTNAIQHRLYREAIEDGTSPYAQISQDLTTEELYAFAWSFLGGADSPSSQPIVCFIIHSGDIDVTAMKNTIHGIISRMNGGYKMTAKNYNIPTMNSMDSCGMCKLSDSEMGVFGGFDPLETFTTTDKWWTTLDGITFTDEGVMPTKAAHLTCGKRDDGFVWAFGANPVDSKHFCWKLNTSTKIWTVVDGDLTAGDLAGLGTVQWGFFHNNEMYWALSPGGVAVELWKSSNGVNWTFVSDLADYAINSAAYSNGTAIRYTGGGDQLGNYVTNIYESTDSGVTWNVVMALPSKLHSVWPCFFKFNGHEFIVTGRNLDVSIYEGGIYRWNGTEWINTLIPELSSRHAIACEDFLGGRLFVNGFLFNDSYLMEKI